MLKVKEENINEASDWLFEQIEGMTDEEFDNLIEEADELYNGEPTPENFSWYIQIELHPTLSRLRSEKQLK